MEDPRETRKELHVTRIRGKGEPEFFDPSTDIRKVMPAAINISLMYLKDVYKDDSAACAAFEYMYRCYKIFQIRLAEDKARLCDQVDEYEKAMAKVEQKYSVLWMRTVNSLLTALYACFVRRDVKVDEEELRKMMDYAHLTLWKDVLSDGLFKSIRKELQEAGIIDRIERFEVKDGFAVERETGSVVQNIKGAVAPFIGAVEDLTWDEASDACDRIFQERAAQEDSGKTELIALGLAYPSYKNNQLGLVMEDDGHKGEA